MTTSKRTLTTRRLRLRPFAMDDLGAYAAIRSNSKVVRFLAGGDEDADQVFATAKRNIDYFISLWEEAPGYGPWAIELRESGGLIGQLGLRLLPDHNHETELLYMLDEPHWGKGLATEGSKAALEFGFSELKLEKVIALAFEENLPSIRVMRRLGMKRHPGLTKAFGFELVKHSISEAEWQDTLSKN